jgi:ADP-heptose:LPS heptosyltransferase
MDLALWVYIRLNGAPLKKSLEELRDTPKTSILVFSNTALGDTLLSTPAIKSLRDSFPEARITLFVHKNIYPLLEGAEYIDNFIVYHGGYKKFFSTVMQLRHTKADIALLLHSNGPQDIPMAIMSGAKTILKTPTKSSYKHHLSYEFAKKEQHTIEDRLDLVRAIGGDKLTTRMLLPQRYYEHKKREILPEGALVVGFQPGAANIYKMWPVENFKKLAKMILAEYPNTIIAVTGSKKEHRLGEAIREADSERIINFCGKFGIENLPKLISEMDVLVTNDTGTMHVAIALGVPTVELFGATDSEGIGVYQDKDRHIVIQKTDTLNLSSLPKAKRGAELMHQISVREVAEASKKLLRNSF